MNPVNYNQCYCYSLSFLVSLLSLSKSSISCFMQSSSVHIFGWHNDIQRKWGHFKHGYLWNLFEFEMICVCQHFFRATAVAYHAGSRRICLLTLLRLLLGCLPTTTFLDGNSVELFCWHTMNIPESEMKINIFILNIKVALSVAFIAALLISLLEF